jgi:ribosomal protein uL23
MAEKKEEKMLSVDPWTILEYPLLTEKSIGKIETENKLVFIVKRKSNKKQIRWATEKAFNVKVTDVKTLIDRKGRKKAWIQLAKEYPAADIATRLGML